MTSKATVSSLMLEAGWLKAEAEGFLAPADSVTKAQETFDAAWRAAKELFAQEQKMSYLTLLKAAACGLRPPASPWSTPASGCALPNPDDPVMRKLMLEKPREFLRRWKERIGQAAGIDPRYVRIDSDCLGGGQVAQGAGVLEA